MAASIAGVRKLHFYTFGEQDFSSDFESALEVMKGKTVGWVWERVKEFRYNHTKQENILQFITSRSQSDPPAYISFHCHQIPE